MAAGILAVLGSAPVQAASPSVNAQAHAIVLHPVTLVKNSDLDFGSLSVGAVGGTAVISPAGALSVTGGVLSLGGSPRPAQFTGAASKPGAVKVMLPTAAITLTRIGGPETMLVDSWTQTGAPPGQLPRNGSFTVEVGATLHVNANQVGGDYVGSFTVTVDYK